jgi:hypothetical protein
MYSVLSNFQYCKNDGKAEEIKAFMKYERLRLKNDNEVYLHGQHLIVESKKDIQFCSINFVPYFLCILQR